MGEFTNLKITTPEDLNVAEEFLRQRAKDKQTGARQQLGVQ
jgi:2-C-methyl-D-erythritol 4-phosphate cytidylyltransferase